MAEAFLRGELQAVVVAIGAGGELRDGAESRGDSPASGQFGAQGRKAPRGPDFAWSDFYLTKWFAVTERVKLRFDVQFI